MHPFFAVVSLALALITPSRADAGAHISVTDDSDLQVNLSHPAQRVIALAPHLVEILFAVDAGDRVVGTVRHADYPLAASELPVVGDAAGISFESVIGLRPDLIVNWRSGVSPMVIARLASMGLPVYQSEPRNLEDVAENIRELAMLVGRAQFGKQLAEQYLQRLQSMRAQRTGARQVAVFYQVWTAPLMTIGSGQILNQAISVCGGRNIFADLPVPAPQVSVEAVLNRNPEVILYGQSPEAHGDAWQGSWQKFASLAAVRGDHLYSINADLVSRPGPRLLDGVAEICNVVDQVRAAGG